MTPPDWAAVRQALDHVFHETAQQLFGGAAKPEPEPEPELTAVDGSTPNALRANLIRFIVALRDGGFDQEQPLFTQVNDALNAYYALRRNHDELVRDTERHERSIERGQEIVGRLRASNEELERRVTALTEHVEKLRWLEALDRQRALPVDAVDLLWYAATQQADSRPSDAVRARVELLLRQWYEPAPIKTSGGVELTDERIAELATEAERGYDAEDEDPDADPDPKLYEAFRRERRFRRAADHRIDTSEAAVGTADVTIGHGTGDGSHDGDEPLYALLPDDWPRVISNLINRHDEPGGDPALRRHLDLLEEQLLDMIDDWVDATVLYNFDRAKAAHDAAQRATGAAPAAPSRASLSAEEAEPCG